MHNIIINSSGWLTFDLSWVIELLKFQELLNLKIRPVLNHGWWRVGEIEKLGEGDFFWIKDKFLIIKMKHAYV